MGKRKQPITSMLAEANSHHFVESHEKKIVDAIRVLQLVNSNEIANYLDMKPEQVNRRLKTLREMKEPEIYRTEITHPTTQGNKGSCYAIVGVELPESILDGIMENGKRTGNERLKNTKSIIEISENIRKIATMTQKEHREHILALLQKNKNHTVVKHMASTGKIYYRIRDAEINPITNFPESVFNDLNEKNLITKINDREWQLKQ